MNIYGWASAGPPPPPRAWVMGGRSSPPTVVWYWFIDFHCISIVLLEFKDLIHF